MNSHCSNARPLVWNSLPLLNSQYNYLFALKSEQNFSSSSSFSLCLSVCLPPSLSLKKLDVKPLLPPPLSLSLKEIDVKYLPPPPPGFSVSVSLSGCLFLCLCLCLCLSLSKSFMLEDTPAAFPGGCADRVQLFLCM